MESVSGIGVLDKTVAVLAAVAAEPRSLQGLLDATGLPRATAHRLAGALVEHGWLRRDEQGRYDLGIELAVLGRLAAVRVPLVALARPVLTALREQTGESVQLFVRDGSSRVCVVSLQSPHGLQWLVPEGARFPLPLGSAGRVLADDGPAPGGPAWVESVEEREPGVASVSAPVVAAGEVIAAVSASGPLERIGRHPGRRLGAVVADAADQIERALSGTGAAADR